MPLQPSGIAQRVQWTARRLTPGSIRSKRDQRDADRAALSALIEQADIDRQRAAAITESLEGRLLAIEGLLEEAAAQFARLHDHVVALTDVVHANTKWSLIGRGTEWAAAAPLEAEPTVSVILPTRDRRPLLQRAIASVLAQSYTRWELIVVNDGSTDDTSEAIAELAHVDDRITSLNSGGVGGAAARNAGLEHVGGDIVTFLDDDNTLASHWLRAVADHMGRVSECRALYGAQLRLSIDPAARSGVEVLFAEKFDLADLLENNYIDLGALAVRSEHPELRFDPDLKALQDWEMIARIAAVDPLTPLPALASCYSLAAPDRISEVHGGDAAVAKMRKRLAARLERRS